MRITPLTDDYNPRDNLSDQYLCEYEATLEVSAIFELVLLRTFQRSIS